jgi:hypothetical protein
MVQVAIARDNDIAIAIAQALAHLPVEKLVRGGLSFEQTRTAFTNAAYGESLMLKQR